MLELSAKIIFNLVSEEERRGIQDAFRRLSSPSGYLGKATFIKDLLGSSVPLPISERIFSVCGGGGGGSGGVSSSVSSGVSSISPSTSVFLVGSHQRGLGFKETLVLLVLLTRGTTDEKTKCKFFQFNQTKREITTSNIFAMNLKLFSLFKNKDF